MRTGKQEIYRRTAEHQKRRTAEQQNSRTAEQQNSRTGEQKNRRATYGTEGVHDYIMHVLNSINIGPRYTQADQGRQVELLFPPPPPPWNKTR